ncbi:MULTISPECIES: cell division protein FtsL [Pseudoalteromonas]|uniref:Cell division protein FtsL n=1 Tax=Pseudoalteromonas ruthenica TaxID=151081 RepID=A0A0F4PLH4_9GAMM|nr:MULTISPECIES: cell division protein FtsL [Pseudoalteromonas]KJY95071.1 cell division protein FtsL [Pseudoalteromonas ruthenica]KJY98752.1 cell division protein FtsL [Pseudoalteromonas ruthenica]MCF2861975.1 cell division protein FtsL [Pseudoalteromonas sp. CNAT2-18]MCG7543773.1 cell division protein FtsL [Pseudoalteromonas sp. MM17-2]MCG7559652.1 cell division protein FtsL [Pseudoalteromonas sp. CNAT2-18.1]|tara:strand:- start:4056 stop:4382 length:327 start_codon:yes stop_codon:yes gene_type:complete
MSQQQLNRHPNLLLEILRGLFDNKITLGLLFLILISALAIVQVTHLSRAKLIAQDRLLQERDELDLNWRYLLVEEEFYSQHARIEQIAKEQLDMKRPTSEDEEVVIVP